MSKRCNSREFTSPFTSNSKTFADAGLMFGGGICWHMGAGRQTRRQTAPALCAASRGVRWAGVRTESEAPRRAHPPTKWATIAANLEGLRDNRMRKSRMLKQPSCKATVSFRRGALVDSLTRSATKKKTESWPQLTCRHVPSFIIKQSIWRGTRAAVDVGASHNGDTHPARTPT